MVVYTIEYRPGYGWFLVGRYTVYGFQSRRLLIKYLERTLERGYVYAPTARECYGR